MRWLRRRAEPDPLGTGLWRRVHDDCATAARHAQALDALTPHVRDLAEHAQRRWPSASLDVPADAAGRACYDALARVVHAFREAAYRERLARLDPTDVRQATLLQQAVTDAAEAVRAATDPAPPAGTPA